MKVVGSNTKKLLVGLLTLATVISILQVSPDGITAPVALATQAPTVSTTFEPNLDNQIFSSVTIAYTQSVLGAKIVISSGYQRGYDQLKLKYTGGASLSTSFDSSTGTLSITGTASGTEYQRIIQSVYFYTTSRQNIYRTIYWNLGANVNYYSGTGNYYEWISTSGRPSLAWTTARSDCSTRNHLGLTGYLATITSSSEFSFILQNAKYNTGWIGGSDYTGQNTWRWMTGPEGNQEGGKGLRFYYSVCSTYYIYNYYYYWYLPYWYYWYYPYYYYYGWYYGLWWYYYYPYYGWFQGYCQSYWWSRY